MSCKVRLLNTWSDCLSANGCSISEIQRGKWSNFSLVASFGGKGQLGGSIFVNFSTAGNVGLHSLEGGLQVLRVFREAQRLSLLLLGSKATWISPVHTTTILGHGYHWILIVNGYRWYLDGMIWVI